MSSNSPAPPGAFQADPMVPRLLRLLSSSSSSSSSSQLVQFGVVCNSDMHNRMELKDVDVDDSNADGDDDSETFGLVIVAGWPHELAEAMQTGWEEFQNLMRSCFAIVAPKEHEIQATISNATTVDAVYCYPASALHITVATLHAFTRSRPTTVAAEHGLISTWRDIVRQAQQDPTWPNNLRRPLSLRLVNAQIGSRAGILLWQDDSGTIDAIRTCLQKVVHNQQEPSASNPEASLLETLHIPNILHSTVIRFHHVPLASWSDVQIRFHQNVLPALQRLFPPTVTVSTITLACERVPYMHMLSRRDDPNCARSGGSLSSRYILETIALGGNSDDVHDK